MAEYWLGFFMNLDAYNEWIEDGNKAPETEPDCDCGGEKAKELCARWCSRRKWRESQ